jgi:hypothetical protein
VQGKSRPLIIGDIADLRGLTRTPLGLMPKAGRISLQLDSLDKEESAHGCGAGTIGLLLAALIYPAHAVFIEGSLRLSNVIIWLVLSAMGAIGGKIAGLAYARLRLKSTAARLAERLEREQHALTLRPRAEAPEDYRLRRSRLDADMRDAAQVMTQDEGPPRSVEGGGGAP